MARQGKFPALKSTPFLLMTAVSLAIAVPRSASAADPDANPSAADVARREAAAAVEAAREAAADAAGSASVSASVRADGRPLRSADPARLSDRDLRRKASSLSPLADNRSATPEFAAWASELAQLLKTQPLDAVAATMAPQYNIAPASMHALARDWLVARVGDYGFANSEEFAGPRKAFQAEVARHVGDAGYAPLALEIAGQTLGVGLDCENAGFGAILASAPDKAKASWALARGSSCPASMRGALSSPNTRTSALIMLLSSGEIKGVDAIAPKAWLLSEGALANVDADGRPKLHDWLARELLGDLLAAGFDAEALALYDAMDSATRAAVFASSLPEFTLRIDGASFSIPANDASWRAGLAAALVLAGRSQEAAAINNSDGTLPAQRALVDCLFAAAAQPRKADQNSNPCNIPERGAERAMDAAISGLFVQAAIEKTDRDLYPLVELGFSGIRRGIGTPAMVRLRCQMLSDPQYAALCRGWREEIAGSLRGPDDGDSYGSDRKANAEALNAAGLAGWTELTAKFDRMRVATLAWFSDGKPNSWVSWSNRSAVEPDGSPFVEKSLPEPMRTASRKQRNDGLRWPRGWSALPQGFAPVRIEKSGNRAVAVSLSGHFDPSGEVAAGGYWVHVSDDGGKTWQMPLYTGLADHFPYVVPSSSKLPLLNGDALNLEVEIALLDTRTITYPPVGIRTRKTQRDLYLEISLETLRADRNNDGLSDIAAHHLLLDQEPSLAPFVVGSDLGSCPVRPNPRQELRSRMLMRLLGGRQDRAILEPIDRPEGAQFALGWTRMPSAKNWPLFLKGDPKDFACMRLLVAALVYNAAGEVALQRKTPDFRLLEVPPMIMNREGTRGFMIWSLGWTGGTTLAFQKDDGWDIIDLESWIT